MAGNSYVSHKHKLVVFWSPKCACTAVVDWFCTTNGIGDKQQKRKWLVNNGYLYDYKQSIHLVCDLGYKSVQFTREPYGRSVSAYLNKFYIYQNIPLVEIGQLEGFSRSFISGYNSHKNLPIGAFHGLSFVEYLEYVDYLITNKKSINHHWDSQLPRDVMKRVKPTYMVKQECFDKDLTDVNSALGFDQYVPKKSNETDCPVGFIDSDIDFSNQNSIEILEKKIFLRKTNLLNYKTKLLIEKIYAEDFKFFDYEVSK